MKRVTAPGPSAQWRRLDDIRYWYHGYKDSILEHYGMLGVSNIDTLLRWADELLRLRNMIRARRHRREKR